jgi:transposase
MDTSLAQLSKQELIALLERQNQALQLRQQEVAGYQQKVSGYEDEIAYLKAQVEQFKRMLFGQKRERFEADSAQMSLPFQAAEAELEAQIQQLTEKIEYVRRKQAAKPHPGYYWVYHSPIDKTVLFDYQPTRGAKGASALLQGFRGYLQTDGYGVYDKVGKQKEVVHLACMAHARREFDKALLNDKARAEVALLYIQALYAIEQKAREQGLSAQQRKELRLAEALPVLNAMGKWISEQLKQVLPKSGIGKALRYSAERWDKLCAYLYDGMLEIDNNLVENAIRPVALGRKNYLFAGSHEGAKRAAMIYSFFAICKKHEVNPYEWLKHTLEHINSTSIQNLHSLYPQNFKNNM